MTKYTPTPDEAKAPTRSRRLSRKQFDGYLHKLYGCPGNNDVTPHYVFGGDEEDDFYVEVFLNAPDGGTMIAVHHGPRQDHVDVFSVDDDERGEIAA
ncbi:hypothetical protein [Nioella ostreopsis]|uniref:hypothetical protein n=1 Tax=Nioella ostreopsis TaxID=2448479 RepID=UPI000FDA074B|nr:hypothetical protein [Nioella ostreopsis]